MKISIIIPTLNEAAVLPRTLLALQGMRSRGHEVIVVDGGSTDETQALARGQADVVLESRPGRALQMNQGAAAATGDTLWFVHADSLPPDDADAQIFKARQSAVWGRFNLHIEGHAWQLSMVAWFINHRSRITGVATGDQGIFVSKAVFDDVGGFPSIDLMEDVALSKRLRRLSPAGIPPSCMTTSGRRWDDLGPWKTIALMWKLRFLYWLGTHPHTLAKMYRMPRNMKPRAHAHIIVFAKAPVAGYAKTRLIPKLGPNGAAQVAERLLFNAVAEACAARLGPVTLCVTPNAEHPIFHQLAAQFPITLALQPEGDLGQRMHQTFRRAFLDAPTQPVLLMGTDAPQLNAVRLQAAARELSAATAARPAVFIPALDGGYALVGLCEPAPHLFEEIQWSTPRVLQQTRARARHLGTPLVCLEAISDVDEPEDLQALPPHWLQQMAEKEPHA